MRPNRRGGTGYRVCAEVALDRERIRRPPLLGDEPVPHFCGSEPPSGWGTALLSRRRGMSTVAAGRHGTTASSRTCEVAAGSYRPAGRPMAPPPMTIRDGAYRPPSAGSSAGTGFRPYRSASMRPRGIRSSGSRGDQQADHRIVAATARPCGLSCRRAWSRLGTITPRACRRARARRMLRAVCAVARRSGAVVRRPPGASVRRTARSLGFTLGLRMRSTVRKTIEGMRFRRPLGA